MKSIFSCLLLGVALSFPFFSNAETAMVKVAERSCKVNDLKHLFQGEDRWHKRTVGSSWNNSRENLSDDKCSAEDINLWISELQAQCVTYFDVIAVTPLSKGAGQISYYNYYESSADSRAGGLGYSFTDRLIMTYRCL